MLFRDLILHISVSFFFFIIFFVNFVFIFPLQVYTYMVWSMDWGFLSYHFCYVCLFVIAYTDLFISYVMIDTCWSAVARWFGMWWFVNLFLIVYFIVLIKHRELRILLNVLQSQLVCWCQNGWLLTTLHILGQWEFSAIIMVVIIYECCMEWDILLGLLFHPKQLLASSCWSRPWSKIWFIKQGLRRSVHLNWLLSLGI